MRERYMPFRIMRSCKLLALELTLAQFILTSCNQNSKSSIKSIKTDTLKRIVSNTQKDTNLISTAIHYDKKEIKIIDTIYNLKEVKDWEKYLDKETKGLRHIQTWIADTPTMIHPYYVIQVGEDNGTNLVTHFNFLFYPDTKRILYLDAVNDDTLTLKQWRRKNGM